MGAWGRGMREQSYVRIRADEELLGVAKDRLYAARSELANGIETPLGLQTSEYSTESVPAAASPPRTRSSPSAGSWSTWLRSLSKETYIALLAAFGVACYLIARYLLHAPVRE